MKKVLALVLALAMVLAATSAMAVTLTYAEVNPESSIVGQTGAYFKQRVEELSNGEIEIDARFSGVLGTEAQIIEGIVSGDDTVDVMRISVYQLNSYGCPIAGLVNLPYTFVSREHYWNMVESDVINYFKDELENSGLGLHYIAFGEEGFRHFFLKSGVEYTDVNSLKGLKIRVSDDPIAQGYVGDLGANPTIVSFSELYSALQTGVVDGAEQPIANYQSNAFPEVAPTLVLDGHTLGAVALVITDSGLAKLTDEQKEIIYQAGADTQAYNKQISTEMENAVLEELKASGVNVIEVTDKDAYVAAVQPTVSANMAGLEDIYAAIVACQ